MALIEKLAAIANAIRSKTGKTEGLTLEQMPGEIEGIETGGVSEQDLIDGLMVKTWPSGKIAINGIPTNLDALKGNKAITAVSLPDVTTIGAYCFDDCTHLAEVNVPNVTSIGAAFCRKTAIESIYMPKATGTPGVWVFSNCKSLTRVETAFEGLSDSFAEYCDKLKECVMLGGGNISFSAFRYSYAFNTLIIRGETLTNNIGAFEKTPFKGHNGSIGYCYVPRALISEYQQATNWSALYESGTCIFRALEDYTVDGTTTGEMDWDKIEAEEATA